jgi:hypothetical protein
MNGVFATLPQTFFSPLSSQNREHYAALLATYYRAFQESPHGVERSTLMNRYTEYISLHYGQFAAEEQESEENETESRDIDEVALFSDGELATLAFSMEPARYMASRFLRKLMGAGWMSEETLPDFTRLVNMAPYAKPFFEALARVEEGLKTEYESHVVAVYSLLAADAVTDNGHYAVLNAHAATVALIDSLKVLSQSIRNHYERLTELSGTGEIRDLLHLHYDLYASDVLDGAYKRLKTSDNLSRYRPKILKRVGELRADAEWIAASAERYARISRMTSLESREKLVAMLDEIRDTLKAVDPLLDEIDRRNTLYAKTSLERVRTLLEPDSTLTGKIAAIARAVIESQDLHRGLAHHVYALRVAGPDSRYRRWLRETVDRDDREPQAVNEAEIARAEAELRLRLARQLSPRKIEAWLDAAGGADRPLSARGLVKDADSFVRLIYSVVYADSDRPGFGYFVEEGPGGAQRAAGYEIPDIVFRSKA